MLLQRQRSPDGRKIDFDIMLALKNELKDDWKDLGRALSVKEEDLKKLKEDKEKEADELAFSVLLLWTKKENGKATVKALLACLRDIYRQDLAEKVSKQITSYDQSSPSDDVTKESSPQRARGILGWVSRQHQIDHNLGALRKKLMDRFQSLTVNGLPSIKLNIKECYVDLILQTYNADKIPDPLSLEAIFKSQNDDGKPCRILIEGHNGYGKTTLAYKMCCDWALKNSTYISHFDVVLLLPLRKFAEIPVDDSWKALNIFLLDATLKIWKEADTPWAIIKDQSKRILFLLDGFDEIDKKHAEVVWSDLLWNDTLTHVTMIVTAKPGTCPNPEEAVKSEAENNHSNPKPSWHRKIDIVGILRDKHAEFVRKYSKPFTEKSQFKKNSEQAVTNEATDDSCECPLILVMTAAIAAKGTDQHHSMTDLYKGYYNAVARHFSKEIVKSDDLFCKERSRKKPVADVIYQLGKLGKITFDVLQQTETRYFAWVSLLSEIKFNPNIYKFGLFPKNDFQEDFFSEPIHTSLLEFAIAFHLSETSGADDWKEKVRKLKPMDGPCTSYIVPFLKDLMGEKSSDLLQALGCNDVEYSQCFYMPGFNNQLRKTD